MTCQHEEITLSFMITGHTKFSPDWCFGLLKKRYRRTKVGSLTDLVEVVNESSVVNVAADQFRRWDGACSNIRLANVPGRIL